MAASRSNLFARLASAEANVLVLWLLAAWWIINLLQAAFIGLANDESYYLYYSQRLAWGYFDHPPMVALLVRLTSWIGGALGLRLGCTLLQPLYLLLFWHLIRPEQPTRRDALVYVLLCFSQPLLQLYGFMALPDAPLMLTTVLLLWTYKRLCARPSWLNASLMGVAIALLGYSKYQGALVVVAVMVANPRLLRRWHLWYAAALGLLLMLPHFWWQYTHDWVSLRYHLVGRNVDTYRISYTLEYLALLLFIFNPLWLWHYVCALFSLRPLRLRPATTPDAMFRRALWAIALLFLLFFLPSTRHGHVQPQWLLPVTLCCVALLFDRHRHSRYVATVGWVCLGLFLLVRVVAVANPIGIKGELWHQREQYEAIARVANGRPVVFMHTYTAPCKYTFYTGGEAYCTPYYFLRHSQWQYDTADRALYGREVVVGNFTNRQEQCLPLPMGGGYKQFYYNVVHSYLPTRELKATATTPLHVELEQGQPLPLDLEVDNPYHFDVYSNDSTEVRLLLYFAQPHRHFATTAIPLTDTLRAHSTTSLHLLFPLPKNLLDGTAEMGLSISPVGYMGSDNGLCIPLQVRHTQSKTILNTL